MGETFYIFGGGDRSVGIEPTEATINIEDNYNWDDDMRKQFKKFLNDFYDNGKIAILTEEEEKERRQFEGE